MCYFSYALRVWICVTFVASRSRCCSNMQGCKLRNKQNNRLHFLTQPSRKLVTWTLLAYQWVSLLVTTLCSLILISMQMLNQCPQCPRWRCIFACIFRKDEYNYLLFVGIPQICYGPNEWYRIWGHVQTKPMLPECMRISTQSTERMSTSRSRGTAGSIPVHVRAAVQGWVLGFLCKICTFFRWKYRHQSGSRRTSRPHACTVRNFKIYCISGMNVTAAQVCLSFTLSCMKDVCSFWFAA